MWGGWVGESGAVKGGSERRSGGLDGGLGPSRAVEEGGEPAVSVEAEEELENCVPSLLAAVSAPESSEDEMPAPPSLQPEVKGLPF